MNAMVNYHSLIMTVSLLHCSSVLCYKAFIRSFFIDYHSFQHAPGGAKRSKSSAAAVNEESNHSQSESDQDSEEDTTDHEEEGLEHSHAVMECAACALNDIGNLVAKEGGNNMDVACPVTRSMERIVDGKKDSNVQSVVQGSNIGQERIIEMTKTDHKAENSKEPIATPSMLEAMKLHERFNHPDKSAFLAANKAYGLGIKKDEMEYVYDHCEACISGRAKRNPVGSRDISHIRTADEVMDCWHIDTIGPYTGLVDDEKSQILSLDGKLYSLTIVDEATDLTIVETMGTKDEAGELLRLRINEYQTKTGRKLKRIRPDGAGEFLSETMRKYFADNGTEIVVSPPGLSEMNGRTERRNQRLVCHSRCNLIHSGAPPHLWSYDVKYMAFIENRLPFKEGLCPLMRADPTWKEIDLTKIQPFASDVHVLHEEDKLTKLSHRGHFGVFLGVSSDLDDKQRVYYNYAVLMEGADGTLEVKAKRNVKFLGSFNLVREWHDRIVEQAERSHTKDDREWVVDKILADKEVNKETLYLVKWKGFRNPTWEPERHLTQCKEALDEYTQRMKQELRKWNKSKKTKREKAMAATTMYDLALAMGQEREFNYRVPANYREARAHPDADKWKMAEQEETNSLKKNHVFKEEYLPPGRRAIGSRYVYAVKRDENGMINRHKVRWVAQGFSQQEGIDFTETFSPTTRMKTLKLMFRLAAAEDWEIKQLDFDTAFLNAELEEEIYIRPPEGYEPTLKGKNVVLKLQRALYGLKQASREWWITLDKLLVSLGYRSSPQDESLYYKKSGTAYIFISVYVDDMAIFYPKRMESSWIEDKSNISREFKIKDIGDCTWMLNMQVIRDRENRMIRLSQESYIEKLIARFGFENERPRKTPYWKEDITVCPDGVTPIKLSSEELEEYRSIIGSLLYAANITRMDIAYITNALARQLHEAYNYHLQAAYHVLGYLVGTPKLDLVFNGQGGLKELKIEIFTDSDWAGERKDRISCGGNVVRINHSITHWEAIKQKTIALSSCEAELYAYCDAVREAIYLREWFQFYLNQSVQVNIYCDNRGTLEVADHSTSHRRTKHIEIRHFFVRDHLKRKEIKIAYIATDKNLADILTKQVNGTRFQSLKQMIYPLVKEE